MHCAALLSHWDDYYFQVTNEFTTLKYAVFDLVNMLYSSSHSR